MQSEFRLCQQCGKEFSVPPYLLKKGYGKFCCRTCFLDFRALPSRPCEQCGKPFISNSSNIKKGYGKYCSRICHNLHRKSSPEERFWPKVKKTEGCWIWEGGKNKRGYGVFKFAEKQGSAHRFSWELHNGTIPEGLQVLHNCPDGDNPSCVNPDHLWLGTNLQNRIDSVEKNRHSRGERQGHSKLTEAQVREIRRQSSVEGIDVKELAQRYGIGVRAVYQVLSRKNWKHVA